MLYYHKKIKTSFDSQPLPGSMTISDPAPFPEESHDHRLCINGILTHAEAVCKRRQVRLTQQRRQVLQIVASSHTPLGAYEILERLEDTKKRKAPITVYRALDFLMEQGLVHRLASLNAFIACFHSSPEHTAQFFICRECHNVAELHSDRVTLALRKDAQAAGFQVDEQTVEISGLCSHCA